MDASSICTPCKVKLAVSHHSMNAAHDEITVDKPLVFVVEPPKDVTQEDETQKKQKKKNKQSKPAVNMNTFGNGLSISKFKTNTHFTIGFRCRQGFMSPVAPPFFIDS